MRRSLGEEGRRPIVKKLFQELRPIVTAGGNSPKLRMKRSSVATPFKTMCLNRLSIFLNFLPHTNFY